MLRGNCTVNSSWSSRPCILIQLFSKPSHATSSRSMKREPLPLEAYVMLKAIGIGSSCVTLSLFVSVAVRVLRNTDWDEPGQNNRAIQHSDIHRNHRPTWSNSRRVCPLKSKQIKKGRGVWMWSVWMWSACDRVVGKLTPALKQHYTKKWRRHGLKRIRMETITHEICIETHCMRNNMINVLINRKHLCK